MKLSRFAQIGALTAVAALTLSACAVNERTPAAGDADGQLTGTIAGAGASSQEVAVQAWTAGFQTANPDVEVTYDAAGSGAGRESFQAGAVAFAGSDRPFTAEELTGTFAGCTDGSDIIQLPTYISPIAVIFNVAGVDSLDLDAATLAGLFSGEITNWNDPAVAALNPDVTLPDLPVTVVHRADDSGTTENFTDYLYQAAPAEWTWEPDGVWPATGGANEAAQGTSGVVSSVTGGNGTIGYADASRAAEEGLSTVAIKVGDEFVEYSPEAAAAVVDASPFEDGRADGDLAIALDRTTDAAGVYPIVLISYMIACEDYTDAAVAPVVKGFLEYVASPEGQDAAAASAGNAPISDSLREQVDAAIALIATE